MRVHPVVPSIRSREVTWAQRSGVRHGKDALQRLDFSNGLVGVHSVSISNIGTPMVKQDAVNDRTARVPRTQQESSQSVIGLHLLYRPAGNETENRKLRRDLSEFSKSCIFIDGHVWSRSRCPL